MTMPLELELDPDEIRSALDSQFKLEDSTDQLAQLVQRGGSVNVDALRSILADLQSGVSSHKQRFRDHLPPIFYNERTTRNTAAVMQRTFDIPELLEMILENVNFDDLMAARLVNRQFNENIQGSTKLQQYLGLKANKDCFFSTPLNHFPDHRYELVGAEMLPEPHGNWYGLPIAIDQVEFCISIGPGTVNMGTQYRQMLVCQPPIYEMEGHVSCCGDIDGLQRYVDQPWAEDDAEDERPRLPAAHTKITNEKGITLGQVYDAMQKLLEDHGACPMEDSSDGNSENESEGESDVDSEDDGGAVDAAKVGSSNWVAFHATIKLQPEDPIIKERRFEGLEYCRREKSCGGLSDPFRWARAFDKRHPGYSEAVKAAHDAGQPLPTRWEFKKSLEQNEE